MVRTTSGLAALALIACMTTDAAAADEWAVDGYNRCSRNAQEAARNREDRRREMESLMAESRRGGGGASFNSMNPAYRFEPAGYLRCNPDVVELIAKGKFTSAAHHYCTVGSAQARRSMCSDGRTGPLSGPYRNCGGGGGGCDTGSR